MAATGVLERNPSFRVSSWTDNDHPRWKLDAVHFDHRDKTLSLMIKYGGSCTIMDQATMPDCQFKCATCPYSIYHQLQVMEKQFNEQSKSLCCRSPKVGDQWEISLVYQSPKIPKYITVTWECLACITPDAANPMATSILGIIADTLLEYDPKIFEGVQLQYIKIMRFDTSDAIEVSNIANRMLVEILQKKGISIGS